MTTEYYLKKLNLLNKMSRKSKEFRELSESLEISIENIPAMEFERKDFLMSKLTDICTQ